MISSGAGSNSIRLSGWEPKPGQGRGGRAGGEQNVAVDALGRIASGICSGKRVFCGSRSAVGATVTGYSSISETNLDGVVREGRRLRDMSRVRGVARLSTPTCGHGAGLALAGQEAVVEGADPLYEMVETEFAPATGQGVLG